MAATWLTEVAFPGPIVAAGVFARMAAAVAVGGVPIAVGVGFRVQAAVAVALTLAAVPALAAVLAFHLVAAICVRTVQFDPGQGILQAAASLVLLAAVCIGTDSWIGGFAAVVEAPLERCLHDVRP